LIVAESVADALDLPEVLFMPAASAPQKRGHAEDADDRRAMIVSAIAGNARFKTSDLELRRGGVSFTVDTLRELNRTRPTDRPTLILGADSIRDLPTWREPIEILRLADVAAVARPGHVLDSALAELRRTVAESAIETRVEVVESPLCLISSTELRERIRLGRSVRYVVPESVEQYVRRRGLYR
jgi:nicotinate-nucleotide adenylyltransferase